METKSYKSVNIEKNWHLVDAEDKVLGRLAVKIATILSGKNKAQYSPNADLGDFVIVVNADKVKVTGNKFSQKNYYHHTQYPGGLKTKSFEKMQKDSPEKKRTTRRQNHHLCERKRRRRKRTTKTLVANRSLEKKRPFSRRFDDARI